MDDTTISEGKTPAIIAYLTIIGSIIALIINSDKKNPFAAFHIRQGLGLCLTYMILGYFVSQFNSWLISMSFWIGLGMLFIYGLVSAINGNIREVPILGPFYQKIFANIGS